MASTVFALKNQRGLCFPSFSSSRSSTPSGLRSPSHKLFFAIGTATRCPKLGVFWKESEKPTTVEMEPISALDHFDQLLAQPHPFVVDWMANWCRKCIYLKPKLEKLAAEFYPTIKFYYVDVNDVPKALVERGGVSVDIFTRMELPARGCFSFVEYIGHLLDYQARALDDGFGSSVLC